jgi:hypothetical protein
LRYRTEVDATGRAWQVERVPGSDVERRIAAEWVVGSGNHTVSFLGRAGDRLVQLPLTWYTQRGLWDLSPGYERVEQPRFERGVEGPCLFCHNDLTPLRSGSADAYEPPLAAGIGCNRCHGDGAAHVAARQAGRTPVPGTHDPWIFNPRHAPPALQLDVCRACHLQGDAAALRPGRRWDAHDPAVPLSDHHVVFAVAGPADEARFSIASHAERLAESRCATESTTPLVCTTCHDPHRPAAEAERAAGCARCHGPSACAVPAGKRAGADCVPCHMRRGPTSDIPHVRFTDHRIARRAPETPAKAATPVTGTRLVSLTGPLPPDEAARLTGLAHTHLWERLGHIAHRRPAIEALRGAGGAADVLAALGRGLMATGDAAGAVEAFARAAAAPDAASESGLALDHATALNALGRRDDAIAVLRAAGPERRPDVADALALALLSAGRAAEAASAASAGVAVAPGEAVLQARLGTARLRTGDAPGGGDRVRGGAAARSASAGGRRRPGRAARRGAAGSRRRGPRPARPATGTRPGEPAARTPASGRRCGKERPRGHRTPRGGRRRGPAGVRGKGPRAGRGRAGRGGASHGGGGPGGVSRRRRARSGGTATRAGAPLTAPLLVDLRLRALDGR